MARRSSHRSLVHRARKLRLGVEPLEDRATPSTFAVTNTLDPVGRLVPGSLRWALAQANLPQNQGSTVEIQAAGQGPLVLRAGELRISSGMTIVNDSGAPLSIVQATPGARVLHVLSNPRTIQVVIAGAGANNTITLTGGSARNGNGGGILVDNTQNILTLSYVNVLGNVAAQVRNPLQGANGNGGGIYSRGAVTLDHSTVAFNTAAGQNAAAGHAGGIYTDQGVTLIASHVDANSARNAGGILNVFGSVELLDGSSANGNTSTGQSLNSGDLGGGGIGEMDGNVLVSQSQVSGNHTVGMYSGGVVLLLGGITVTNQSQIDGNINTGPGGGIAANFEGPVIITHGSQVDFNTGAGLGGGIVNFSEVFGITVSDHSEVAGNRLGNAENSGTTHGLVVVGSDAKLQRTFVGAGRGDRILAASLQLFVNACAQRITQLQQAVNALPNGGLVQAGGGIASPLAEPVEILGGSRVSDNRFVDTDSLQLASGIGGGIFSGLGPITIDSSTISGNLATNDGGGIWTGASLTLINSTVRGNVSATQGGGIFRRGILVNVNSSVVDNQPDSVFPPI